MYIYKQQWAIFFLIDNHVPLLKMFLVILHCFLSRMVPFSLLHFGTYGFCFIWFAHLQFVHMTNTLGFFFKLTLNLCFNLSHLCLENFLWSQVCEIMCTNCYWYLKFKVNLHVYNVANYQFELFCNWTFLISCCQRARCVRVWILLWILQMCDHIKVHVHIKFQTSNR